jgi:predicted NBD/HSP70 family sugar kinase
MLIGIDLGGTKIELAVLDHAGALLHRERVPTPAGDYAGTIAAVAALVAAAEARYGRADGIGIGTPGSISRVTGRLKNSNSQCLNGKDLSADLSAAIGRALRIANDADCFALSEAVDGAAAGAGIVFGVILGTGVGGGLVVDGRLLGGPNGITGEWGHNPLALDAHWGLSPPDARAAPAGSKDRPRPCYCGRLGCVETVLCGPALAADHALWGGDPMLSARDIAQRAQAGDPACAATIERYAGRLAQALAVVINIVDPDVIVLGGGVSNIAALYELVPRRWSEWVFSDEIRTRLVRNRHGDSSGVRGAAWLSAPRLPGHAGPSS